MIGPLGVRFRRVIVKGRLGSVTGPATKDVIRLSEKTAPYAVAKSNAVMTFGHARAGNKTGLKQV